METLESEKYYNLLKVTQLVNGRVRIRNLVIFFYYTPPYSFMTSYFKIQHVISLLRNLISKSVTQRTETKTFKGFLLHTEFNLMFKHTI